MPKKRLKGVYGKPLSKAAGQKMTLTKHQLDLAGQAILDAVVLEIKRDQAKQAGIRSPGQPVPLPTTDKFWKSFSYRISGTSTIEIISDWPTAEAHTTPSDQLDPNNNRPLPSAPIEMTWLARPKVKVAKLVQRDGQVVFRTTPNPQVGDKFWMHPGFRKYTFLERGIRKGREEAVKLIVQDMLPTLLGQFDILGD